MWCNTLLQCGGGGLPLGLMMNCTVDEVALGGEVFLSSRELVWCELVRLVLFSMAVASPIYSGLGPLPKCWREGIPQRPDLKGAK